MTYSDVFELPTAVRNALDEDDQRIWMEVFNRFDPKTREEFEKATEEAWWACRELPSSFSFHTIASVDDVDKDREVMDIESVRRNMDDFIRRGGVLIYEHQDYTVGHIWKCENIIKNGIPGIAVWGNVYGGDNGVYDQMRRMFLDGKNSLSIAGEADKGRYQCDERGCYMRRNVKEIMEISLCKIPANHHCTILWRNPNVVRKSASDDVRIPVDEYWIHKSYSECPFLGLKRSLKAAGFDAHASDVGVFVKMTDEEYERSVPFFKSSGLSYVRIDDEVLLNDKMHMLEISFKKGVAEGWMDFDGRIRKSISKDDFAALMERQVLAMDDKGFRLAMNGRAGESC